MAFDISMPVDTVFNAIDDLSDLAEHAHSAWTHQQMMDLAYGILQQDLRAWNRMTAIHRTWANMIKHFRDAQADLSFLPTAGDMYQQANTVSTMADLVAQRLLDTMPNTQEAEDPVDTVNTAITQREIAVAAREAALLAQMQELTTLMRTGTANTNAQTRNQRSNRGRAATGGRGRTNEAANKKPRLYCWSHGACAHGSAECNTPLTGHVTTATFHNMQGGSTKNLQYVPTNHSA